MADDAPAMQKSAFGLNPHDELNDLRMSEKAHAAARARQGASSRETVEPMSEEFHRLGEGKADRWSYAPGQLEVLEAAKDKAKAEGLWNFFLPDAETGEGLTNLDYAYIAVELGKNPLASEMHELRRARHRQHGSAGARRHARAEGEVAEAAAATARSARPSP